MNTKKKRIDFLKESKIKNFASKVFMDNNYNLDVLKNYLKPNASNAPQM